MTNNTANVMKEFSTIVDTDKSYDLNELKDILSGIYKTMNADAKKEGKKSKVAKADNGDNEKKVKRAPTAYNNFVSITMKKIRSDDPSLSAKDAMVKAGALWKEMTDEQKEEYKTKVIADAE